MTDRTERLQELAQRQVPAQVKLIGAQRRGDTEAEQEARAELDDIDREVNAIDAEMQRERGQHAPEQIDRSGRNCAE